MRKKSWTCNSTAAILWRKIRRRKILHTRIKGNRSGDTYHSLLCPSVVAPHPPCRHQILLRQAHHMPARSQLFSLQATIDQGSPFLPSTLEPVTIKTLKLD